MEEQSVIHNTFVIEKSYPVKPERVFAAFADAQKKQRWFVESAHSKLQSYELNFREGGVEKSHSTFGESLPVVGGKTWKQRRITCILCRTGELCLRAK